MVCINDYENAKAKYFSTLSVKTTSLVSMSFHKEFLGNIMKSFDDYNRLNFILSRNVSEMDDISLRDFLLEDVVILTDNNLKIVFASNNLSRMNGYLEKEVLGKSPKIFQGSKTNEVTSREIRDKINQELPFEKKVINYKKNGKTYDCLIKGYPIKNKTGQLTHFIAFEKAL